MTDNLFLGMRRVKMKSKRLTALALTAAIVATMTGCGGKTDTTQTTAAATTAATTAAATTAAQAETGSQAPETTAADDGFSYPMEPGDKLTIWWPLDTVIAARFSNYGDSHLAKNWQAQTGVELEFQHPPVEQQSAQFNLIMADGDYPDMMFYNWLGFKGGPETAIKDGVILELNDIFEQYCPNIMKFLAEHPDIDRMIKTDDGRYYCFPWFPNVGGEGYEILEHTWGPMIRKDWLDELGLDIPVTIDDWTEVLTAFKEKKGVKAPWTIWWTGTSAKRYDPFLCAYGQILQQYVGTDGKIHLYYGEDGYRDYLALYHQWYEEGLLDVDFASVSREDINYKILNGETGSTSMWSGVDMGNWYSMNTDPNFELVATPWPVVHEGDTPEFGAATVAYTGQNCVAITTACKDVERAARMLDWCYGEEGHLAMNFGIEGESYEMVDGYPKFTDLIVNNPEGLTIAEALCDYSLGTTSGPLVVDPRLFEQYYTIDAQKEAAAIWKNNGAVHVKPPYTMTAEENSEFSKLNGEMSTYVKEMTMKFILGTESLDNWDTYVENLKAMGLERAIELNQIAYERYLNR